MDTYHEKVAEESMLFGDYHALVVYHLALKDLFFSITHARFNILISFFGKCYLK